MTPYEQENMRHMARVMDALWSALDRGMRVDPIRSDLIAANLPITPEGEAIVEDE